MVYLSTAKTLNCDSSMRRSSPCSAGSYSFPDCFSFSQFPGLKCMLKISFNKLIAPLPWETHPHTWIGFIFCSSLRKPNQGSDFAATDILGREVSFLWPLGKMLQSSSPGTGNYSLEYTLEPAIISGRMNVRRQLRSPSSWQTPGCWSWIHTNRTYPDSISVSPQKELRPVVFLLERAELLGRGKKQRREKMGNAWNI